MMKGHLLFAMLCGLALAQPTWSTINDKMAPSGLSDLRAIQDQLTKVLPAARAATVCIELDEGFGSGVIVAEDGLILTAAHVTGGVDTEFHVRLEDGRRLKARALGLNADNDAAMAKLIEPGPYPWVSLELGEGAQLGDWVFALGHSGGYDEARGCVARLGRLVRVFDQTFQTDCNLIGGDSGGPLFDLSGRLVAIHSRVGKRLPENMHVPVAAFRESWDAMLEGEFLGDGPFASRPVKGNGFLGVEVEPAGETGLKILRVGSDSPAEKAGLAPGDILLSLDGQGLESVEAMQAQLAEKGAGDPVVLERQRGELIERVELELADRDA